VPRFSLSTIRGVGLPSQPSLTRQTEISCTGFKEIMSTFTLRLEMIGESLKVGAKFMSLGGLETFEQK